MSSRDDIRSKFFSQKPKTRVVEINGAQIELRQPSLGDLISRNNPEEAEKRDNQTITTQMLCNYCYVPGTDEKVFDMADRELVMSLPNNKAWQELQGAISDLINLDGELKAAAKNSGETLSED